MKKITWKILSVLLALVFAFSAGGCAVPAAPDADEEVQAEAVQPADVQPENEPEPADAETAFNEFLDQQFKDMVTEDTIELHYTLRYPENFGIERMAPTLGDFGSDTFARYEKQNREDLETLKSFPFDELGEEQQLIYDILEYLMELDVGFFENDMQYFASPLAPGSGLQFELPIILAEYKFYDESDVTDYLALLLDVDRYFKAVLRFEEEKSDKGFFMADFTADKVIEQCNDFIAVREHNLLIETFNSKIDEMAFSEEQAEAYKEENKTRVLENVIPAYENLASGLKELKGTGVNEAGLSYFEKGKQYYEYRMKSDIGSDKSVETMINLIYDRVEALIYGMSYFMYSDETIMDSLQNVDFGTTDPEGIIQMLIKGMADHYPDNTGASHTLKEVHPSLESSSPPAFYMNLPIDDFSTAVIYLNNSAVTEEDLFSTLAHEGYPGHLYQDTYFKNQDTHPLRKVITSLGYIEGWATYAELNSFALTSIPDMKKETAMVLSFDEELRLAIQTRCDIGVNYEGWKLDDIQEYMKDFGVDNLGAIRGMYEYVVGDPGKTLRYYIGYLEFRELADYAYQEMGDAFSLKDFNQCLLDVGPAPFFAVREAVEKYIRVIQ